MRLWLAAAVVALLSTAGPASAEVLTFDNLRSSVPVPNGYGGLNWSNVYVFDTINTPQGGYSSALVSSRNVAYNAFGTVASFSSTNPFTLNSAYFGSPLQPSQQVLFIGYVADVPTYSAIVSAINSSPTFYSFNWSDLSKVTFVDLANYPLPVAFDNLSVNVAGAVPEPATWALMILGMGAIGFAMRRRARANTNVTVHFA
ncbi:PEPxxWA-CTERM sorting domain-containing protein [Sphingomonas beigongshangi]|uniref:PEPxxWA-CTERM sorting domain-containing protein n=1 Tax=Sphingomonas beigongshangi TaxID=2782540 RepID=UPI00193C4721|nr:PEPxxWA-CTERM sorting domain-containing protein [Sphingomonas beigongshangi]